MGAVRDGVEKVRECEDARRAVGGGGCDGVDVERMR